MKYIVGELEGEFAQALADLDAAISRFAKLSAAEKGEPNVMITGWSVGVETVGYSREDGQIFETDIIRPHTQGPSQTRGILENAVDELANAGWPDIDDED